MRPHARLLSAACRWLPILSWLVACAPWLRQAIGRSGATEDLGIQVLAGGAAVWLVWRGPATNPTEAATTRKWVWWRATAAMLIYAVASRHLPLTVVGVPALGALLLMPGPWLRRGWPDPAVAGLALLALPAMMMVEFFFGYPLRLASALLAAGLMKVAGLPVTREGAALAWQGINVWVDAPCSGVRMLWSGMWLTLLASGLSRLGWIRTGLACVWGLGVVVAVNALRVTGLCLVEGGLLPIGNAFHTGLGVMLFAAGALLIVGGVSRLARYTGGPFFCRWRSAALREPVPRPAATEHGRGHLNRALPAGAFLLACAMAVTVATQRPERAMHVDGSFPGWPTEFEGQPLTPTPLAAREALFNEAFPGRMGRFTCDGRVVILRWVMRPTHRVHSAADCLRYAGWQIGAGPLQGGVSGNWSTFRATKNGQRLFGRERCTDSCGRSWPDVSAWFWAAIGGHSQGPWWVVTVVEAAGDPQ